MSHSKDGLNEAQRTCLRLYGITKEQAHAQGICVKCRETAAPKNRTIPDQREYHISGLCGECFDAAFLSHEDSGEPLEPKMLEARNECAIQTAADEAVSGSKKVSTNEYVQRELDRVDFNKAASVKTDMRTLAEFVSDVKLPAESVFADVLKPVNDLFRASARPTADQILAEMANTFRERNKVYGDNYKRVGAVMAAMFPNGIQLKEEDEFNRWHLFELIIVKLTRFANSGLTHADSIHDAAVYAAMVESLTIDNAFPIHTTKEKS